MNKEAPEGQVFVCAACGKRSRDKYGYQKIDRLWDESCMLNSVLVYEDSLKFDSKTGRVISATAVEENTDGQEEV